MASEQPGKDSPSYFFALDSPLLAGVAPWSPHQATGKRAFVASVHGFSSFPSPVGNQQP